MRIIMSVFSQSCHLGLAAERLKTIYSPSRNMENTKKNQKNEW